MNYRIQRSSRLQRGEDNSFDVLKDMDSFTYIDNRLVVEEIINKHIRDLPQNVIIQVLYYLKNPSLLKTFIKTTPSSPEKYVIALKTYEIQRRIMSDRTKSIDISLSSDRVANVLMMSGLYNENPAIFVMLSLMKDFRALLQFLVLFEGQDVKIPSVEEINRIFSSASKVSSEFESGEISIGSRELLATLVTDTKLEDINVDTKLNRYLDEYLTRIVEVSIGNYDEIQKKIIKHTDYTDPKKVEDTYKMINRELASQAKLLKEIVTTVSTIRDIRSAIDMIRKKNPDESNS